jgi:hypothetical protein
MPYASTNATTINIGPTEASPTPDPYERYPTRPPSQQSSHVCTSADMIDSSDSSTNTSMPLDQHG